MYNCRQCFRCADCQVDIARPLDAELARPTLDKDKNTKSIQATCIVLNTKRQCKSSAALRYTLASVNMFNINSYVIDAMQIIVVSDRFKSNV